MKDRNRAAAFTLLELMLVMSVLTLAGFLSVIAIGQAQAIMAKMQKQQGVWRDRHRMSRVFREDVHQATHVSLRDPQFIEIRIGDLLVNYAVDEGELVRKSASGIERFSLGTPAHWEIEQDHQVWLRGVDFEVVAVAPIREQAR
jgi:type II secretory pathway pseudopilin PulG